jgi:hypothetical protein
MPTFHQIRPGPAVPGEARLDSGGTGMTYVADVPRGQPPRGPAGNAGGGLAALTRSRPTARGRRPDPTRPMHRHFESS